MYAYISSSRPHARPRLRRQWRRHTRNALLILAATVVLLLGFARVAEGGAPARYESVIVEPGDTLWSIAGDRYPGTDIRNKVIAIEEANHLNHRPIRAGEMIKVPSR